MNHRLNRLFGVVVIAACGTGSPGSPGPGSRPLAHDVPAVNPLVYTISDTTGISMNMQGQSMQIDASSMATIALTYGNAGTAGTPVTVEYRALDGRFSNPMTGTTALTAADLPGGASVTVTRTGDVTVDQIPTMTPAALQVLGTESTLKRHFQSLPGRDVTAGAMWTDTVSSVDDNGGLVASTTSVIRSTLAGDTTVQGRRLQLINVEAQVTTEISGSNQGFEIRQNLSGSSRGTALWDPAVGALAERNEIVSLAGTMALPALGMTGIPVGYQSRQTTRLQRQPGR